MSKQIVDLHDDNASSNTALDVKKYLTKHRIPLLEHPPYSSDLAPCDFFLFPLVEAVIKGTIFELVDTIKESDGDNENAFRKLFATLIRSEENPNGTV